MAYYKGPKSDHFDGSRFFNPWKQRETSFFYFLKWKLLSSPAAWPKKIENQFSDTPPERVAGSLIRVSFVGHSTILIQTESLNILTDPVWSDKIGPFPGLKLARAAEPGIAFKNLPKIDVVLISHNHYDHLDLPTIQRIWKRDKSLMLCPLGNDLLLKKVDPFIKIEPLDWEQTILANRNLKISLEPAQHWSSRGLCDRDKALWGAFVLQTSRGNIYFGGDSGYYQPLFQKMKEKYGNFCLAFLPIGSYEPRWFMRYAHMNPEEAVKAHLDLGGPPTIAIHYGTFRLADEGPYVPLQALSEAKKMFAIPDNLFVALKIGQFITK